MIFAYSLVIGCSLMHIFCCGIPLIATIIGLTTTLGFASNSILENTIFENFEQFEIEILFLSGIILLTAYILKFRVQKINCCQKEKTNFCKKTEKINNLFLKISGTLYLSSIMLFAISHML